MANLNINDAGTMRFANGGRLILTDSTNNYTVLTIVDGTLRLTEGGREVSQVSSAGTLLPPTLGDERPSTVEADFLYTGEHGTNTLQTLMSHAAVADGLAPEFGVILEWADDTGAETGVRCELTRCYFTQPLSVQASGDQGPDRVQLRMASRDPHGEWEDYDNS
jgi:hypothetical protein